MPSHTIQQVLIPKTIGFAAWCLLAALSTTALRAADTKHMNEDQLCRKLEDCYQSVKSAQNNRDQAFDIYVEKLSYLVLVAGSHASGSKCLDAIFSKIQKESPTLSVPRFVMTPAESEKFIDDMAGDDANDLVYSAYRRRARSISELIAQAKSEITRRSGYEFDPSVQVIRAQ